MPTHRRPPSQSTTPTVARTMSLRSRLRALSASAALGASLIAMVGAFLVPSVADAAQPKPQPPGNCTTSKGVTTCTTTTTGWELLYSENVHEEVGHCSYDDGPWGGEPGTLVRNYRRDHYGTTTTTTTYLGNKQTGRSTSSAVMLTQESPPVYSCEPGAYQEP